jgi:hypothetical protein
LIGRAEYDPAMPEHPGDGAVVEWLLDGDPAMRRQVMRDLSSMSLPWHGRPSAGA